MDVARLRARCERKVRELGIAPPLDVAAMCADLARRRGRPIRLLPMSLGPANPSGLWVLSDSADYIFYEGSAGTLHREHILLHELGHLAFGHSGGSSLSDLTATMLAPTLHPAVVRRLLCRGAYDDRDEQEAELFATLALVRADFQVVDAAGPGEAPAEVSAVLERLRDLVGTR